MPNNKVVDKARFLVIEYHLVTVEYIPESQRVYLEVIGTTVIRTKGLTCGEQKFGIFTMETYLHFSNLIQSFLAKHIIFYMRKAVYSVDIAPYNF